MMEKHGNASLDLLVGGHDVHGHMLSSLPLEIDGDGIFFTSNLSKNYNKSS